MTETLRTHEMGQDALLSEREVLEGLGKEGLVDFILTKGVEVAEIERLMSLASDALEGYGTTVEVELDKREIKNGNQT